MMMSVLMPQMTQRTIATATEVQMIQPRKFWNAQSSADRWVEESRESEVVWLRYRTVIIVVVLEQRQRQEFLIGSTQAPR